MSLDPSELAELRALEAQVRALRIRIEAASSPGTSSTSDSPVTTTPQAAPWSAEWVEQLRQAVTPEVLLPLDLSPLGSLIASGHLGSAPPNWTATSRLARIFREGMLAKHRLDSGDFTLPSKADLFFQNRFQIVLYCPEKRDGFWSSRSRPFSNLIGDPNGRGAGPDPPHGVYSGIASKQEVSTFLLGAQRPEWPVEL